MISSSFVRALLLAVTVLGITKPINAQERGVITGSVVDAATLRPLSSVQVSVPEAGLGTITDTRGQFLIPNVPAGPVRVRLQLIGFAVADSVVSVVAGQTASVNFALTQEALQLDGVVVTGTAGRQERRAQGATISNVNVAQITEVASVQSVTEVLQGRIPGVSVSQGSGVTGSAQQIRIRGASSISLSNEPLIYVDGIRIDTRSTALTAGAVVNPLNFLNPDEIESVEIVKGPAAATLYGADASAGVIQIITKRGAAGSAFRQSFSLSMNRIDATFTPHPTFAACRAQDISVGTSLCNGLTVGAIVSDQAMLRYNLPESGDQRGFTWTTRGGGERWGLFSSLGVDSEQGILPNNHLDRVSARLGFNAMPSEQLRLEFNFPIQRVTGDFPVTGGSSAGWTTGGMAGSPLTVGTPTDGWFGANRTPTAIAAIENSLVTTRVVPDLKLSWDPTAWMVNRFTAGADIALTDRVQFYPKNDLGWYSAQQNRGQIQQDRQKLQRLTLNYLGTATLPNYGAWGSTLSWGTEIQVEEEDFTFAFGNSLTTNAARSVTAAAQVSGGQSIIQDRRVGFYGQWEPNFRERLYFQFGARADRFAAFGTEAPWFLSPSARVSYVLSDESFWNVPSIPSIRLRAAFGTTGRAPVAGAALQTYSAGPYLTGPGTVASGIVPLNAGNPNLRAERGEEFEAGFDAALFSERVGVEFTFYNQITRDLLLRVPQPPSLGFVENSFENIGKVLNRGVEISLQGQLIATPNFGWEVQTGVNALHNEVLDLGGVAPFESIRFGVNRVAEGRQVGAYFTHRVRSVDVAGGRAIVSDTVEYVGNLLPTLEGNLSSTVTMFGNWRIYGNVDWKRNVMQFNATDSYRERNFGVGERWVRRFEILSDEERLRRFGPYVTESGEAIGVGSVLEEYLEPADILRLNEISLAYSLPVDLARRMLRSQSASISMSGRNLLFWSPYSGFYPDVQNEFDAIAGRADFFTLPPSRRIGLRVDVTY